MADLIQLCIDGDCSNIPNNRYTAGRNITIQNNVISADDPDLSNYYNKTEVNELLSDLEGIRMEVVSTLPATGESNVIYLLDDGQGNYEQWVYTETDGWIDLGSESIDLTNYYTKTEADTLLNGKQNKLSAGDNVTISNSNVVSAEEQYWTKDYPSLGSSNHGVVQNNVSANVASATNSLASGSQTTASGNQSHAEGYKTTASGTHSHAEGRSSVANGAASHAGGFHTEANGLGQNVFGVANVIETVSDQNARGTYVEIVGNGTFNGDTVTTRSNARTLKWNGDEELAGKLTIGKNPTNPMDVVPLHMLPNYTAGTNVQISSSGVISATDTKYTGTDGIVVSGTTIRSGWVNNGTITNSNRAITGYCTASGTALEFEVLMGNWTNGLHIDLTALTLSIRGLNTAGTGGAYAGGSSGFNALPYVDFSMSRNNLPAIRLVKSDGWGIMNNTPIAGLINFSGKTVS